MMYFGSVDMYCCNIDSMQCITIETARHQLAMHATVMKTERS